MFRKKKFKAWPNSAQFCIFHFRFIWTKRKQNLAASSNNGFNQYKPCGSNAGKNTVANDVAVILFSSWALATEYNNESTNRRHRRFTSGRQSNKACSVMIFRRLSSAPKLSFWELRIKKYLFTFASLHISNWDMCAKMFRRQ